MSFDSIKEQAALLVPTDRRRLLAFLITLEDAQSEAYRAKLREKIDDQTPESWLTIDPMDERLKLRDADR